MKLDVYKCTVDEFDDFLVNGIFAVSFVDSPAIGRDFVALSKDRGEMLAVVDKERQILTGALLIPDIKIYRENEARGEHYITFSKESIRSIHDKMMRDLNIQNTTHQHLNDLRGNYLIESWIIDFEEFDKSRGLGFDDLPVGTLMVSYKITDKEYWDKYIKTQKVKGFSLEGFFNYEKENFNKSMTHKQKIKELKKQAIELGIDPNLIGDDSGKQVTEYELKDERKVFVNANNVPILEDSTILEDGTHPLKNGKEIVVENSVVTKVQDPESDNDAEKKDPKDELSDETVAIKIDDKSYDVPKEVAEYIKGLEKKVDDSDKDPKKEESDAEKMAKEIAALKDSNKSLKKTVEELGKSPSTERKQPKQSAESLAKSRKEYKEKPLYERI